MTCVPLHSAYPEHSKSIGYPFLHRLNASGRCRCFRSGFLFKFHFLFQLVLKDHVSYLDLFQLCLGRFVFILFLVFRLFLNASGFLIDFEEFILIAFFVDLRLINQYCFQEFKDQDNSVKNLF